MKFLLLPQVQLKAVVTLSRTSEHRCQLAWRCVMGPQQNVTIMVIDHCFPLSHHTLPKGWLLCFVIYLHSLPSAWSHNEPVISFSRHDTLLTPHVLPPELHNSLNLLSFTWGNQWQNFSNYTILPFTSRKSTDRRKQITVIKESQILNCKFMPRARRVEGLIAGMSKTIPNNRFLGFQ